MQTQFWDYWICRCITYFLRMIMILTPPFCIVLAKGRPCFIISFTRAASTTLIRSTVSFNCKESSVKIIIQFECTLALTIFDSSCLSPPSLDHWSRASKGNYEHCLWIRVTVCLQFVYNSSWTLLLEVLRSRLRSEIRTTNSLKRPVVLKAASSKK